MQVYIYIYATIGITIKRKQIKIVIKCKKLTSQCFQVVLAERYHLLRDTLDSVTQESFRAAYGETNSNQGLSAELSAFL